MNRHPIRRLISSLPILGLLAAVSGRAAVVPLGPEFQVNVHTDGGQSQPSVATGADGRVFMVWSSFGSAPTQNGVFGRLFDAGSVSFLSDEILIASGTVTDLKVLAEPGGGYFVAWVDGAGLIHARRCGANGQPAGVAFLASLDLAGPDTLDVVGTPSGGHMVVSAATSPLPPFQTDMAVDLLDNQDQLVPNGRHPVFPGQSGVFSIHPRIAVQPGGGFVLAWLNSSAPTPQDVWAEHLSPEGIPLEEAFRVNDLLNGTRIRPSVVVEDGGGFAVVWRTSGVGTADAGIWVQRYDAADARRGDKIQLAGDSLFSRTPPEVVTTADGRHLVMWPDYVAAEAVVLGRFFDASWQPAGGPFQVTGNGFGGGEAAAFVPGGGFVALWPEGGSEVNPSDVFGRLFSVDCMGGAGSLCLNGDRFSASVAWHDPRSNARGTATALPLTTDTGAFWFFSAGNAELLVKVLDGRPVNGHWWVFFGALTDLEYDLTVIDTESGVQKVYHNPPYTLASGADIFAFIDPPPPGAPEEGVIVLGAPRSQAACPAGACLGAFQVSVDWVDPATGQTHQAAGVPLSDNSAYFWFFDPSNIELIVKVLDGHAVNGHWWVFYGALSNVEYTIHVDWPDRGLSRTYHNPAGHMGSRADTQAFP
ncbi:MAG TPA: hypothetical protein VH988_15100 [Thermoanaerobaculia bacterium]|jgi:hypothetical protein|nr:hypothetical protein [Thermoanaerobaculia bacterium]